MIQQQSPPGSPRSSAFPLDSSFPILNNPSAALFHVLSTRGVTEDKENSYSRLDDRDGGSVKSDLASSGCDVGDSGGSLQECELQLVDAIRLAHLLLAEALNGRHDLCCPK